MQITLIVFVIAPDRISALAVDDQEQIWKRYYSSGEATAGSLFEAGIASAAQADELQEYLMSEECCPILKASIEYNCLEDAGFVKVEENWIN
jgi:hypothetical protein